MKAEPRFLVAPLASEPLTVTEAMKVLAEWMVADPERGVPSITVSKIIDTPDPEQSPAGTPITRGVGFRIKERRIALGWSLAQLGAAVGSTRQSVHSAESGNRKFGADELHRFSAALGVSIAHLVGEE